MAPVERGVRTGIRWSRLTTEGLACGPLSEPVALDPRTSQAVNRVVPPKATMSPIPKEVKSTLAQAT